MERCPVTGYERYECAPALSLTVSAAAVRVVRDSCGHCGHQGVLDGHLPHAGHILPHPADLRRSRKTR